MSNDATPTNQTRPRVLLAEDSDDDAFFFERAVKKSGAQCSFVRAGNGKAATELLQQAANSEPIDLVFLDLKMPVMSGFEVLEWLRSANLPRTPKVLVLSGSNDHGDRIRAVELGAAGYIVKPIATTELRERIDEVKPAETGARA